MITIPIIDIESNPSLIPNPNYGTYVEGENYNFFESVEERESFMAGLPVPEPVIIDEVAAWRVRAALVMIGVDLENITTALNQLPQPPRYVALQAWEYGNSFNRYSPLIIQLGQSLNINLDTVWEIAKSIDL